MALHPCNQPRESTMQPKTKPAAARNTRLIRLPEVMAICGLSRSSVYAYVTRGEFPAPVKITRQASAWVQQEVQDWVEQRISARRAGGTENVAKVRV